MDNAAAAPTPALAPAIGVFDSGVGGLSVLRALRRRLPAAPTLYLADSAYAPYGGRSADDVYQRCVRLVDFLQARGARLVVVACNTATALAIDRLRERFPALAFVGVEPGIKPAVALSRSGRIGVMATAATVASARVQALVQAHGSGCDIHLLACPGLADAIEDDASPAELQALLGPWCERLRARGVDTVVLGCTHYPLIAPLIAELLGDGIALLDTAEAIAARAEALWPPASPPAAAAPLALYSTGQPAVLQRLARQFIADAPAVQPAHCR